MLASLDHDLSTTCLLLDIYEEYIYTLRIKTCYSLVSYSNLTLIYKFHYNTILGCRNWKKKKTH